MNKPAAKRRNALKKKLAQLGLDTLMVSVGENRLYLSGFTGEDGQFDESAGFLFITAEQALLATDSRYELQAGKETEDCTIFCYREGIAKSLAEIVKKLGTRKMGFESKRVSYKQFQSFRKELKQGNSGVELMPCENIVEDLRIVKDPGEIDATRKALSIAESAFMSTVEHLQSGMTEKEVAWLLEKNMRRAGADGLSFPTIVAAGPNSARPHAVPTDRKIQAGEPILFDWGARFDNYCSDTSRTLIIGKASQQYRRIFDTVSQAQEMAIQAIHAGASTKKVDSTARSHIEKNGFEGKFGHALGHGTGLAVHEGPRLSPLNDTTLDEGTLVTVEPGIYLPEWGGIRLENQVVVRKDAAEVLNSLPLEIVV